MSMEEKVAKEIYESIRFDRKDTTPEWVSGGNSHAQQEARRCADSVIKMLAEAK